MGLKTLKAEFKRNGAVLLISTLVFITSPIFILFFGFLWLLRFLLTLWKKKFKPQLGPLLEGMDSAIHNGSPHNKLQLLNIGQFTTVGGRIDLEKFRTVVTKGLHDLCQDDESGQRMFQKLTTWAGFSVFENERDFKVEDHVSLLNIDDLNRRMEVQCTEECPAKIERERITFNKKLHVEHLTQGELGELNSLLLHAPYKTDTSPWEILLLYNPTSESESETKFKSQGTKTEESHAKSESNDRKWTTVFFLRINHTIADGVGVASIQSHFLDQRPEFAYGRTMEFFSKKHNQGRHRHQPNQKQNQNQIFRSITRSLYDLLLGVPEFISHAMKCSEGDWPPGLGTHDPTSPRKLHIFSFQLSTVKLQSIQKSAGRVTITSVIFAAFVLGISEYFRMHKKKNNNRNNTFESPASILPPHIYTTTIFGDPRRKNELKNKFSAIGIQVPVPSELNCRDHRAVLNEIERSYVAIKNSRIRTVANLLAILVGLLPLKIKPPLDLGKVLIMSYAPWFENPVTILGQPVLSTFGNANIPYQPSTGMILLENCGTIHVTFGVGKEMLESREEAQLLAECFEKQFELMHQQLTQS